MTSEDKGSSLAQLSYAGEERVFFPRGPEEAAVRVGSRQSISRR